MKKLEQLNNLKDQKFKSFKNSSPKIGESISSIINRNTEELQSNNLNINNYNDREENMHTFNNPNNDTKRRISFSNNISNNAKIGSGIKNETPNFNIQDFKSSLKEIVMEKLKYRFNFDIAMKELKELKDKTIMQKLKFWKFKMNIEGTMDYRQTNKLLNEIGIKLNKEEVFQLLKIFDKTGRGVINMEIFDHFVSNLKIIEYPENTDLFLRLFRLMDEDHSGSISTDHMKNFMRLIGFDLDKENMDWMDEMYSNKLDFKSFLSIFEFNSENKVFFKFTTEADKYLPVDDENNKKLLNKVNIGSKNEIKQEINLEEVRKMYTDIRILKSNRKV